MPLLSFIRRHPGWTVATALLLVGVGGHFWRKHTNLNADADLVESAFIFSWKGDEKMIVVDGVEGTFDDRLNYRIECVDVETGAIDWRSVLHSRSPEILGLMGDTLLAMDNGLVGIDMRDGHQAIDRSMLERKNRFLDTLTYQSFTLDTITGDLLLNAERGGWRIDRRTLVAHPIPPAPEVEWNRGKLLAMDTVATLASGETIYMSGGHRRYITTGMYDPSEPLGEGSILANGAFLVNPRTRRAIELPDPKSYLIVYLDYMNAEKVEEEPWVAITRPRNSVARITPEGEMLWHYPIITPGINTFDGNIQIYKGKLLVVGSRDISLLDAGNGNVLRRLNP